VARRNLVAGIRELCLIVGRPTVLKLTKRKMKDSQPFAKLKEVFCQRTCRHKNTTFNFAQPHYLSIETLFSPE